MSESLEILPVSGVGVWALDALGVASRRDKRAFNRWFMTAMSSGFQS